METPLGSLERCLHRNARLCAIAHAFSRNATILARGIIAAAGVLLCLFAVPLWKRFKEE